MAETMDLPAVGNVKKSYVYIGVAGIAGFVAFAYYRRNAGGSSEPAPESPDAYSTVDSYDSPLGNSGTNSTLSSDNRTDTVDTNAEWTQGAVEALVGAGHEGSAVYGALGKYLQFKALTGDEANIVMSAVAAMGQPPVGGPYPIKDALPTPNPTPVAVTEMPKNLKVTEVTHRFVRLDWDHVPNARGYALYKNGARETTVLYDTGFFGNLNANTEYTFSVEAIGAGDKPGPRASIKARTKK